MMGQRITDPGEAVAAATVQLEDLVGVDRLRACRELRDWCTQEIERLAPQSTLASIKSQAVSRLVEQGLLREQAEVEVSGRLNGDRFVVRARGIQRTEGEAHHPGGKIAAAQSWTRADGAAAKRVMEKAKLHGWREVAILYWTEDDYLTDVTRDIETAT
jgi:hypothetical protein